MDREISSPKNWGAILRVWTFHSVSGNVVLVAEMLGLPGRKKKFMHSEGRNIWPRRYVLLQKG